jgi:predicted nucleic acid-binding protein
MFWDSSALVPLLVPEPQSAALATLVTADKEATIWWGTPLECQSALHRRNREHPIPAAVMTTAIERIRTVVEHADTVSPLRAADALQLAAALLWCEEQPHSEGFVSLDVRLREAALKEGFTVLPA